MGNVFSKIFKCVLSVGLLVAAFFCPPLASIAIVKGALMGAGVSGLMAGIQGGPFWRSLLIGAVGGAAGGFASSTLGLGGALTMPISFSNMITCGLSSVAVSLISWGAASVFGKVVYNIPISFSAKGLILAAFASGFVSPFVSKIVGTVHNAIRDATIAVKSFVESAVRTASTALVNLAVGIKTKLLDAAVSLGVGFVNAYQTLKIKAMELTQRQLGNARLSSLAYLMKKQSTFEDMCLELNCTESQKHAARALMGQGRPMYEALAVATGAVPPGTQFTLDPHGDFMIGVSPDKKAIFPVGRGSVSFGEIVETTPNALNPDWNSESLKAAQDRYRAALSRVVAESGAVNITVYPTGHSRGAALSRAILQDYTAGRYSANVTMRGDLFCEPTLAPLPVETLRDTTSHQIYGDFVSAGASGGIVNIYAPRVDALSAHSLSQFMSGSQGFDPAHISHANMAMYHAVSEGVRYALPNYQPQPRTQNSDRAPYQCAAALGVEQPANAQRVWGLRGGARDNDNPDSGSGPGAGGTNGQPSPKRTIHPSALLGSVVLPFVQLVADDEGKGARFALVREFFDTMAMEMSSSAEPFAVVALLGPRSGRSTLMRALLSAIGKDYPYPEELSNKSTVGVWGYILKRHRLLVLEPSEDIGIESFCVSVSSHVVYSCRGSLSHKDLIRLSQAADNACAADKAWPVSVARAKSAQRPFLSVVDSAPTGDNLKLLREERSRGYRHVLNAVLDTYNAQQLLTRGASGGHPSLAFVPWADCARCFEALPHHKSAAHQSEGSENATLSPYFAYMQDAFGHVMGHVSQKQADESVETARSCLDDLDVRLRELLEELAGHECLESALERFSHSADSLHNDSKRALAESRTDEEREVVSKRQEVLFFDAVAELIVSVFKFGFNDLACRGLYIVAATEVDDMTEREEKHNRDWFRRVLDRSELFAHFLNALKDCERYAWYFATIMLSDKGGIYRELIAKHIMVVHAQTCITSNHGNAFSLDGRRAVFWFLCVAARRSVHGFAAVFNPLTASVCASDQSIRDDKVPDVFSFVKVFGPEAMAIVDNGSERHTWPFELFSPEHLTKGKTLGTALPTAGSRPDERETSDSEEERGQREMQAFRNRLKKPAHSHNGKPSHSQTQLPTVESNADRTDLSLDVAIEAHAQVSSTEIVVELWALLSVLSQTRGLTILSPQSSTIIKSLLESIELIRAERKLVRFPSSLFIFMSSIEPVLLEKADIGTIGTVPLRKPCLYAELVRDPSQLSRLLDTASIVALRMVENEGKKFPSTESCRQLFCDASSVLAALVNIVSTSRKHGSTFDVAYKALRAEGTMVCAALDLGVSILGALGPFEQYSAKLRVFRPQRRSPIYEVRDVCLRAVAYLLHHEALQEEADRQGRHSRHEEILKSVHKHIKPLIAQPLGATRYYQSHEGASTAANWALLLYNTMVLNWDSHRDILIQRGDVMPSRLLAKPNTYGRVASLMQGNGSESVLELLGLVGIVSKETRLTLRSSFALIAGTGKV